MAIPLILFLVSFVFVSSYNQTAYACSCMQPLSPDEELPNYDAVFAGKVIDMDEKRSDDSLFSSANSLLVTFDVDKVWKGPQTNTITIQTSVSSASCGFYFEDDQSYIVYANQQVDTLDVSLCSRTGLLSSAIEDLQELGPGISMKSEINSELLPPLKQFKSGISVNEIQCKDNLQLVTKHDNTPACIKPHSIMKLDERGWMLEESSIHGRS